MKHLNYNHLLYFWTVAREGTITRAAEVLHLTPQTVSGQLKLLEEAVGEPLFHRVGRGLALSEAGRVVQGYADEIFALGAELAHRVQSRDSGAATVLNVGIVNSIPKLIAYNILHPTLELAGPVRVVCREGELEGLLGQLAVHRLDLVISDHRIPRGLSVRAYNHGLGESTIAFFAAPALARKYARNFPASLHGAPLLIPLEASALRRSLDDWFETIGVLPRVIGEFDDSALMKVFGEAGVGVFPAPTAMTSEVERMYHVRRVGTVEELSEKYFAISPERKLKHPAVVRIIEAARSSLLSYQS